MVKFNILKPFTLWVQKAVLFLSAILNLKKSYLSAVVVQLLVKLWEDSLEILIAMGTLNMTSVSPGILLQSLLTW